MKSSHVNQAAGAGWTNYMSDHWSGIRNDNVKTYVRLMGKLIFFIFFMCFWNNLHTKVLADCPCLVPLGGFSVYDRLIWTFSLMGTLTWARKRIFFFLEHKLRSFMTCWMYIGHNCVWYKHVLFWFCDRPMPCYFESVYTLTKASIFSKNFVTWDVNGHHHTSRIWGAIMLCFLPLLTLNDPRWRIRHKFSFYYNAIAAGDWRFNFVFYSGR